MLKLQDVVSALEMQGEEMKSYLNRQTGEIVTIFNDDMRAAEEDDDFEDLPDWQQEILREAIDVLENDSNVELPDQREIHEWSIMREFCDTVKEQQLRDALLSAVHGKGAFRTSKTPFIVLEAKKNGIAFAIKHCNRLPAIGLRRMRSHTKMMSGYQVIPDAQFQTLIVSMSTIHLAIVSN